MLLKRVKCTYSHIDPEIEPPLIRGGMRWWFRAMMGGPIGNNIDLVTKAQQYILNIFR